MKVPTPVFQIL
jgi:hypothetical protein